MTVLLIKFLHIALMYVHIVNNCLLHDLSCCSRFSNVRVHGALLASLLPKSFVCVVNKHCKYKYAYKYNYCM